MSYLGFPVSGLDRATGTNGLVGTATPSGARKIAGNILNPGGLFFEELPGSPTIERGEQATIVHKFVCDLDTGETYLLGLARGQLMTDTHGNTSKILSTSLEYNKGDFWILTVTAEGVAGVNNNGSISLFNVPPDDFSVDVVEFNPSIYRHPRYKQVLDYNYDDDGNIIDPDIPTGAQIIQWISGSVNLATNGSQQDMSNQINSNNIGDDIVLDLALELLQKVRQGVETFYLAGFKVTYSIYSFTPVLMRPGGYLEDPVLSGFLPLYYWSDDMSGSSNSNILTSLAAAVAPSFYANGLSFLRQADTQTFQRTLFKITNTWVGLPFGSWDKQLHDKFTLPPPTH